MTPNCIWWRGSNSSVWELFVFDKNMKYKIKKKLNMNVQMNVILKLLGMK